MRVDRRLLWLFKGHVAKEVEEYEDVGDAIFVPILAGAVSSILWIGALEIGTYTIGGQLAAEVARFSAGLVAGMSTYLFVVLVCASAVYATERTELPAGEEVTTRE